VRVESHPDGGVLFERETVLGMPGVAEPVRVAIPPAGQRRMAKATSADLDEGSTPQPPPPVVAGVQLPTVSGDDFEDGPGDSQGPVTVPVDPTVLQQMVERLDALEAENARLRQAQADGSPPEPEPDTAGAKAASRRRGRQVREATPGAKDAEATEATDKTPEPVGS
jgi:hypothetical protein